MKKSSVIYTGIVFKYPECSKGRLLDRYPRRDELKHYLPNDVPLVNINRTYLLNVS